MKNIKLFFYFYFLVLLFLFFVGLFFDLQISQSFAQLNDNSYYSLNYFAIFIEVFGEFPFYFLMTCCMIFFCMYAKNINNKILKFSAQIFLFFSSYFVLCFAFWRTIKFAKNYFDITFDLLTFITFGIIGFGVVLGLYFLLKKIKLQTPKQLFLFAIMIMAVAVISVLLVQLIKNNICVRARFRTINFLDNNQLYKPCWQLVNFHKINSLNLPSDAYKSFPSGHTMSASILLCFVFLPNILNIKSKAKYLCWILPIIFLIIVGFGRIVAGAHFLTDIVFSAFFVGLIYVLFYFFMFHKRIIT